MDTCCVQTWQGTSGSSGHGSTDTHMARMLETLRQGCIFRSWGEREIFADPWGSYTEEAESIHICGTGDGLIKLLGHVRHQQWRPCSDISSLCFVLHRKKRKVCISVYKFKYRKRQAVRKLISEWLNPVHAENPGKGCVCQLTNVGPDQMCKEATSQCPSTLCYYWSKATETELFTLTNWGECPAHFTSVGLKLCNNYWT